MRRVFTSSSWATFSAVCCQKATRPFQLSRSLSVIAGSASVQAGAASSSNMRSIILPRSTAVGAAGCPLPLPNNDGARSYASFSSSAGAAGWAARKAYVPSTVKRL